METINVNFVKEVLLSNYEYWLVETTQCGYYFILLVTFPNTIKRAMKYNSITLKVMEDFNNERFQNAIFLCEQENNILFADKVPISSVVKGYPITIDVYKFLKKALEIDSKKIRDYINLL